MPTPPNRNSQKWLTNTKIFVSLYIMPYLIFSMCSTQVRPVNKVWNWSTMSDFQRFGISPGAIIILYMIMLCRERLWFCKGGENPNNAVFGSGLSTHPYIPENQLDISPIILWSYTYSKKVGRTHQQTCSDHIQKKLCEVFCEI